jgi:hypothetical protein
VTPRHVSGGAGLIDEHQFSRIEFIEPILPRLARGGDVLPFLLAGVYCFFYS